MTLAIAEPAQAPETTWKTVDDLVRSLGDIPSTRIWMSPSPGTATLNDMVRIVEDKLHGTLVELVDGTLVEKSMGDLEDWIASELIVVIGSFVKARGLGRMNGGQGMREMRAGNVRMPDVAFTVKGRLSNAMSRAVKAPPVAPDLWVEVLSEGNTKSEMLKKRRELFASGTRLIWEFEPQDFTVAVYTSSETPDAMLARSATLAGGDVLPGFTLDLAPFWAQFED